MNRPTCAICEAPIPEGLLSEADIEAEAEYAGKRRMRPFYCSMAHMNLASEAHEGACQRPAVCNRDWHGVDVYHWLRGEGSRPSGLGSRMGAESTVPSSKA